MFKKVPGTKDILPEQIHIWQEIEAKGRDIFTAYNYKEIRPPLLEDALLFNRSLGESAEIVQKQMFLVHSGSDVYALRPEATASIVRSYIENSLDKLSPFFKAYYIGPMFRLERPQKGRLRQFHHLGCEVIGSYDPRADVEVISLADSLLKAFSIDGYTIKLNSLGCAGDKLALTDFLRKELSGKAEALCEDCQARYSRNILRILDCKNPACQEIVHGLSISDNHLCDGCKNHFAKVKDGLNALAVKYELSSYLVRGLDYYTRTVFEFTHPDLGRQQDALGAGGRYDNLVSQLGGPDTGAIGFAFGMERLLLATTLKPEARNRKFTFLISLGEKARKEGLILLHNLRKAGISCDTDYEDKSLKGSMRKANDLGARFVLILGDNELEKNTVMLKDLVSGEQKEVPREQLLSELQDPVSRPGLETGS